MQKQTQINKIQSIQKSIINTQHTNIRKQKYQNTQNTKHTQITKILIKNITNTTIHQNTKIQI